MKQRKCIVSANLGKMPFHKKEHFMNWKMRRSVQMRTKDMPCLIHLENRFIQKLIFSPYLVEVTATDLNIRKGPGTNYGKTGKFTGKGVFTITEERVGTGSNRGWGKLKSGAGWISLDYVKRL